jgi:hypothetical protein
MVVTLGQDLSALGMVLSGADQCPLPVREVLGVAHGRPTGSAGMRLASPYQLTSLSMENRCAILADRHALSFPKPAAARPSNRETRESSA